MTFLIKFLYKTYTLKIIRNYVHFLPLTSHTKQYNQMNCDYLEMPYVLPSHKWTTLHDFEVYELLVFRWISQFLSVQPVCSWALHHHWNYTINYSAYCILPQNDYRKFLMSEWCLLSTLKYSLRLMQSLYLHLKLQGSVFFFLFSCMFI